MLENNFDLNEKKFLLGEFVSFANALCVKINPKSLTTCKSLIFSAKILVHNIMTTNSWHNDNKQLNMIVARFARNDLKWFSNTVKCFNGNLLFSLDEKLRNKTLFKVERGGGIDKSLLGTLKKRWIFMNCKVIVNFLLLHKAYCTLLPKSIIQSENPIWIITSFKFSRN